MNSATGSRDRRMASADRATAFGHSNSSNEKKVVSIRFEPAGRVAGGTSWSSDTRVVGHIWQPPCPWPSTMPKPFSPPNQTSLWPSSFLTSTTAAKRAMLVAYRFHLSRNATLALVKSPLFPFCYFNKWKFIDLASDCGSPCWASVKKCVLLSSLQVDIIQWLIS